ncbi:hypothetical protein FH144_11575 [Staphylococcus caledonicus]|uniref:hypothetical protein n=1 Tax=Staphylococcus sp. acrmy TaxID=2929076 RepID=UPI001F58A322|nr:hypothetical protein [Staphylococcus sp. acrmy]MCI2949027.1 hypothetical protein [Staphylococcus sp. acrmy]
MKKILASLGVILLVAILGVAILFAYGSYKDLELKKAEAKLAEKKYKNNVSEKKKSTSNHKAKENEQISNTSSTPNEIQTDNTINSEEPATIEKTNTNELRTTEDGEVIKKTKNGIDYVGEFKSPEEEAKYEREVMSQTGGGPTSKEDSTQVDGNGNPLPEIEVHDFTDDNGDGMAETINGSPNGDVDMDLDQQQRNIDAIKAEQDNE